MRTTLLPLLALLAACADAPYEPLDVKHEALPDVPVELTLPPEAVSLGRVQLNLQRGELERYRFTKQAGKRYLIALTGLTGDLDLYSHYRPEVSRGDYQFVSWNWDLEEEQIDLLATQDGDYYIGVDGYEAGSATLELYEYEPTDEVGWPVSWGHDDASEGELVGGGYGWVEYGWYDGCGGVYHPGLDMNFGSGWDDFGLPVFAVADGVVVASNDRYDGWGNVVLVEHELSSGLRFWAQYGHLDRRDVRAGDRVSRGQALGSIGDAHGQWSPHLHFEIRTEALHERGFPCGDPQWQVEAAYTDPRTFIREH